MNDRRTPFSLRSSGALLLAALLLALAQVSPARASHVEALPSGDESFGQSYEDLSSAWWAWALTQRAEINPVLDATGEDCRRGQHGRIWFLAGTFGGSVERSCRIPRQRFLFVPVLNAWADNSGIPGSDVCPQTSFTEEELRSFIAPGLDAATVLELTVDGEDLSAAIVRVEEGTTFSYTVPRSSIHDVLFGEACGGDFPRQRVTGAVSNGYYVLLAPLPRGEHTVHIRGENSFGFALDVTYHLTVR
jgi:hypothetical protein